MLPRDPYSNRQYIIRLIFIGCTLILAGKAFQLQILDSSWAARAEATAVDKVVLYPARGLILDRHERLLVGNKPVYDLMATYNKLDPQMDTALLCRLLGIDRAEFERRIEKDWSDHRYSKRTPFVFYDKLEPEQWARLQEVLHEFPGFFVQSRNVRVYPYPYGAHVLGYLQEVTAEQLKELSGYALGDYLGANGLEWVYEQALRGKKGVRYVLRDNLGQEIGSYRNHALDTLPQTGQNLITTLDIELQGYAEELLKNKKGAVVAIEPRTGEILALVSAPSYDPNLMTISRHRGKAYRRLLADTLDPLFNRAIMAQYPPGSIFKTVVGLSAMHNEVLQPNTFISCPGYYTYGSDTRRCRQHPQPYNVGIALQWSCNTYFFTAFRRIVDKFGFYNPKPGYEAFLRDVQAFGLGKPLGIDFPGEKGGNVPTIAYYDKLYPPHLGGWKSPTIMSLGIGQGELELTTLQMANLAATIANKGWYITPHLGRALQAPDGKITAIGPFPRHETGIDTTLFDIIHEGMRKVVEGGTARSAWVPGIAIAGKTGTVQNPHGENHSTFIAFAPADNPQIAIAVYVENAGGGSAFAAPLAGLLIERYLHGGIHPSRKWWEDRILHTNLVAAP